MKRLLLLCLFCSLFAPLTNAAPVTGEYVMLVGGPSLMRWEKYKGEAAHDHWWANFVRAAKIRTEQIRTQAGPDVKITWLVFGPGYKDRAAQEKQDLFGFIGSVRDKYNLHLVYFSKGHEVIDYLNADRDGLKIADFEYFGHSNAKCFMFDYSSNIESACKVWLHEDELKQISGRAFARGAFVKSWGCHTGESMAKKWSAATGTRMWGVIGKTQYMTDELPVAAGKDDRWVSR